MERGRYEPIDHGAYRRGPGGHDLDRNAMSAKRRREEPSRSPNIAAGRDVDVDDLAVLIDRTVDVPPPARDLHIGLIDEPAVADRMAPRSGRVGQERREALHPPEHGH